MYSSLPLSLTISHKLSQSLAIFFFLPLGKEGRESKAARKQGSKQLNRYFDAHVDRSEVFLRCSRKTRLRICVTDRK
jgi:hypothetical protein